MLSLHPYLRNVTFKSGDNWWGISLLDMVRKVLGRIIQNRLKLVAEVVLPDSQCGLELAGDVLI